MTARFFIFLVLVGCGQTAPERALSQPNTTYETTELGSAEAVAERDALLGRLVVREEPLADYLLKRAMVMHYLDTEFTQTDEPTDDDRAKAVTDLSVPGRYIVGAVNFFVTDKIGGNEITEDKRVEFLKRLRPMAEQLVFDLSEHPTPETFSRASKRISPSKLNGIVIDAKAKFDVSMMQPSVFLENLEGASIGDVKLIGTDKNWFVVWVRDIEPRVVPSNAEVEERAKTIANHRAKRAALDERLSGILDPNVRLFPEAFAERTKTTE